MRKIAFVDLDDTLFDIKKFKEECFNYLSLYFPTKLVSETYKQAKTGGYFDVDAHCLYLGKPIAEHFGASTSAKSLVEDWLMSKQDMLKSCVFLDAELFLRLLGNKGYEVHILALGTEWFQKAKIEGAGLLQYISGYTVTKIPTKHRAILQLCDPRNDEIVLFDDSKLVIDSVKLIFPKIMAIQVLRDGNSEKISENADAVAKNLEEAIGALLAR